MRGPSSEPIPSWRNRGTVVAALAAILTGIAIAFDRWIVPVGTGSAILIIWLGLTNPLLSSRLLLLLSALYFPIKSALPQLANSAWLDVVLVLLLCGWSVRASLVPRKPLGSRAIATCLIAFLAWGLVEVLRAPSLLYGLFGFRTVFVSLLAFGLFSAASTTSRERTALLGAIVAIGCAVASYSVAEFILVNAHLTSLGSWIDFGRGVFMRSNHGYPPSLRFGFARSLAVWPDPSQAALYMIGSLGLALRSLWTSGGNRRGKLTVSVLILGIVSTLSTWPIAVAVLLIGAGIVLKRPSQVPERTVWLAVGGAAALGLIIVTFQVPIPRTPELGAPRYSGTTLYTSTSNLREAFSEMDLAGSGLYDNPSIVTSQVGSEQFANLGFRWLFLDDLVRQLGLVGILLLLILWTSAIVKSYSSSMVGNGTVDRDQLAVSVALAGLLLASQHYGALLIYGVNFQLVALLAIAGTRERSSRVPHPTRHPETRSG